MQGGGGVGCGGEAACGFVPAPHTHPDEAPDQPQHIRWWRLRRPSEKEKRGCAKYNKIVAAAQAEAALLLDQQEELDLESLQAAILLIFTKVLGTAPSRSEITDAWMDDPVVRDYLLADRGPKTMVSY